MALRQFTLRNMLVVIGLLAACVASLLSPTETWASVISSLVVLILALATIASVLRSNACFATGFAVFGWAHAYFGWNNNGAPALASVFLVNYLTGVLRQPDTIAFRDIAWSWLTVFCGLIGGCIAVLVYSRRLPGKGSAE